MAPVPALVVPLLAATALEFAPAGDWLGETTFKGQPGSFVLHLETDGAEGLNALISLPPIDVYRLPVGRATIDGNRIRIGSGEFEYAPETDTLSGALPSSLVPVHTIRMELSRHDGWQPLPAPVVTAPAQAPIWRVDLGSAVYARLTVSPAGLLVGADDGCLRALALADGGERWRFCADGPIRATPTVAGDAILVHADDGRAYRLGFDGHAVWSAQVEAGPVTRIPAGESGSKYLHYGSAPVVAGETVFVGGHDGRLLALALDDGRPRWTHVAGAAVATPASDGERVYFGTFDGAVVALNAATGELIWRLDTGAPVVSTPALALGRVVIGSRSYDLLALDATDGSLAWEFYYWFSWVESSAAIDAGIAYVGSSDAQRVHALRVADGEPLWSADVGGSAWATPAISADTVVAAAVGVPGYIVDHRASLTALDRTTGLPRWRFVPPAGERVHGFAAGPAIAGGRVFAASIGGAVLAFAEYSDHAGGP